MHERYEWQLGCSDSVAPARSYAHRERETSAWLGASEPTLRSDRGLPHSDNVALVHARGEWAE